MTKQNTEEEINLSARLPAPDENALRPRGGDELKEFVEPEVSSPVDVLQATTFFQATDSGATG